MKLSEIAITAVRENRRLINLLALKHDAHSATIERWADKNEEDGDLTKISSLQVIEEETGLTQDQILCA